MEEEYSQVDSASTIYIIEHKACSSEVPCGAVYANYPYSHLNISNIPERRYMNLFLCV